MVKSPSRLRTVTLPAVADDDVFDNHGRTLHTPCKKEDTCNVVYSITFSVPLLGVVYRNNISSPCTTLKVV